jgi:hypothetical protein
MLSLECDPALIEAAVLAAVRGRAEARAFHDERDPVYGLAETEAREAAFTALHARWFERLGLDRPLHQALGEEPGVAAACARGIVARARGSRGEGADLLVAPPAPPTVLVRIAPETLAAPERALALLRHELLHVADMLDPDFAYEPRLPAHHGGSVHEAGRAERYHVLWDAWVDGRLVRRGRASAALRAERLRDFRTAFPGLADDGEGAFEQFFGARRCTHAELARFAGAWPPGAGLEGGRGSNAVGRVRAGLDAHRDRGDREVL